MIYDKFIVFFAVLMMYITKFWYMTTTADGVAQNSGIALQLGSRAAGSQHWALVKVWSPAAKRPTVSHSSHTKKNEHQFFKH